VPTEAGSGYSEKLVARGLQCLSTAKEKTRMKNGRNRALVWCVLVFCFILLVSEARSAETIQVYTYHIHPPFVTGDEVGQTFELAAQLQAAGGDKYQFTVSQVPRSRLNLILNSWVNGDCLRGATSGCATNWILLWVNQKWGFGSEPLANFNWVGIAEDSNSIISLQSSKVDYQTPASLSGLKYGGIAGHKYLGIDELVAAGKITRIDGSNERDNILKLYKKRVDAILLPTSTINYFMRKDPLISGFADELFIADTKHQSYSRNIMLPKSRSDLFDLIKTVDMSRYQ
jgi:hypothetical protein